MFVWLFWPIQCCNVGHCVSSIRRTLHYSLVTLENFLTGTVLEKNIWAAVPFKPRHLVVKAGELRRHGVCGGGRPSQPTRGSGERCELPIGSRGVPWLEMYFGIFRRSQNAPFCTYMPKYLGESRGLGVVALHQHTTALTLTVWSTAHAIS